ADFAGLVRVGTVVRAPLHGRRVRGWVVDDGVEPELDPAGLRPLAKVVSAGPPPEVVELCRWAAWRYAGPLALLLRSASPPNVVPPSADVELHTAVFPPRVPPAGVDALVRQQRGLLAWPPAADRREAVGALLGEEGSTIVVAPDSSHVRALVDGLRRSGRDVIVVRGNEAHAARTASWEPACAGANVIVGRRVAVLAPVPDLTAVVVLGGGGGPGEGAGAPGGSAGARGRGRARRTGARCTLVSPVPTIDAEAVAGPPVRPPRTVERDGWPRLEVVDLRDEAP